MVLGFHIVGVGAVDDPCGRGIDTYAKHVCRRRRDGSQYFPLFVLFVLFGQAKRTLKEKNHKDTFLLSYFSVTKSTKKELLLSFYNLKENLKKICTYLFHTPCVRFLKIISRFA